MNRDRWLVQTIVLFVSVFLVNLLIRYVYIVMFTVRANEVF